MIFRIILLLILGIATTGITASKQLIFIPAEFRQDFEEGHISGWESYPPFQDSAFDPEFKCSRDNNLPGSKFALMRRIKVGFPTRYEFGFIRKFSLYVTLSSSLSLDYMVRTYGDGFKFEVVLCSKDGKKYTYTVPSIEDDTWKNLSIPLSNFKNGQESLDPGQELEAIYVLAYLRRTNPDVWYRIYLDNVVITGEKPAQFQIVEPKSSVLEHWNKTVLHKHYQAGEAIHLATRIPGNIPLTSVSFTLYNPEGKKVVNAMPLAYNKRKKLWAQASLYTFSQNDIKGRWQGILIGINEYGRQVETAFDIWLTDQSLPHPRLYFGADEIDYYKQRRKEKHWQIWWDSLEVKSERLRKTSNLGSLEFGVRTSSITRVPETEWTLESLARVNVSVYDTTYLLPTLHHYFNIMVPAMHILRDNALIYAVTGDPEVGQFAKDALVAIAGWKTWTHPWFQKRHQESYYPVGELGVRAAFCYDIVYPLMSEEERHIVQEGFLRNCIIPVYREYVVENRIPSSTSNWIANSVSGGLSCALAIYGDNPELGDLEPYLTGLLTKLQTHIQATLDTSGAWGEGLGYQGFAYSNMLPTITALNRVLNYDLTTPQLLRSYLYFLYNFSPPEILDMGDSAPKPATLSRFSWLSSQGDDPIFRWLYLQSPRQDILDFLFGKEHGPVTPPDNLPLAKHFTELGGVIFRSGWSPEDIVFNFRSGPFYNHQHFDQGSFQLRAFGETLVPEAGKAHYYNDPWYRLYYIQPLGHNTVLVDGNPGSQRSGDYLHFVKAADTRAEMLDIVGTDYYGAATGELHKLYRGELSLFERNVIFMQPDYFVIFDRLRSSGEPHEYDWLLHFQDRRNVTVRDRDIYFEQKKASLLAKVLIPLQVKIELKGAPVKLDVPITFPGYVQLSNPHKSKGENFLVVLFPAQQKESLEKLASRITRLKGENFLGVQVDRSSQQDILYFQIETDQKPIEATNLETDGRIAVITTRAGKLSRLAVHHARRLKYDGVTRLSGTMRFTAAGQMTETTHRWQVQAQKTGQLLIFAKKKPQKILLNDHLLEAFDYDASQQLLKLKITAGKNQITLRF